jgi:hypothetical protein
MAKPWRERSDAEANRAFAVLKRTGVYFSSPEGGRAEAESWQALQDLASEALYLRLRVRQLEEVARETVAAWEEIPKITPWPLSSGLSKLQRLLTKED